MRFIIKASGEKEEFNTKKFSRSLLRASATEKEIIELTDRVEKKMDLKTTRDVYKYALNYLSKNKSSSAGRYNLKKALFELGPSGYPFEKFVLKIFETIGYNALVDKKIKGRCVLHEVDILLKKNNKNYFVECKFHNTQGLKCNVKITLYVQARFEDIKAHQGHGLKVEGMFAVTNTKFTSDAIQYAHCVGMKVMDWNYPLKGSISYLVDKFGIYPVTALTRISYKEKKELIKNNIVLCSQIRNSLGILKKIKLKQNKIDDLIEEAESICLSKKKNLGINF